MTDQICDNQIDFATELRQTHDGKSVLVTEFGKGDILCGLSRLPDKSVILSMSKVNGDYPTGSAVERAENNNSFRNGDLLIRIPTRQSALVLLEVAARALALFSIEATHPPHGAEQ